MSLLQVELGDEPEKVEESDHAIIDALGGHLRGKFEEYKTARLEKENAWLDNLRAFNSIYSTDEESVIADLNQNFNVFFAATRMKTVAAYARIIDLLFQPGQRFGDVNPTPIPDTVDYKEAQLKAKQEITQMLVQGMIDQGTVDVDDLVMERADELRTEAVHDAQRQADKMNDVIDDQLKECKAERKMKMAIAEMCVLGDGCIKGVTIDVRGKRKWVKGEQEWSLEFQEEVYPNIDHRSIFDIYPDPFAKSTDDATGLFDRHMMNASDMGKLAKLEGFDSAKIQELLTNNRNGNYVEEAHEIERRSISGLNTSTNISNRFEVLEFWGFISGEFLQSSGVAVDDPTKEYQANVWICGAYVIKAMLNPLMPNRIPYQISPYEFNIHSFWGTGIPEMMKNSQKMMNSAARSIEQNMAFAAGMITEVNTDYARPGEDVTKLKPNDIKLRKGGDPSQPMYRFHKTPDNSSSFLNLMAEFRKYTDEETSMPSYSHGQVQGGMTKTASGMSMLMGAANVAMKATIKNIDDYMVEPLIQSFYDYNMKWSDDDSIKGDSIIEARGSTALMSKEIKSERLLQFMQMTANPVDMEFIERRDLLKEVAMSLDIDAEKFLRTEDELDAIKQQQFAAANAANQSAPMGGVPSDNDGDEGIPPGQDVPMQ
jgi:hypothetical protein